MLYLGSFAALRDPSSRSPDQLFVDPGRDWFNLRRLNQSNQASYLNLVAMLLQAMSYTGLNRFQCPSEITSTASPTTLMAVSSSIAYAGTDSLAAHFSAFASVLCGSIS